MTPPSRSSTGKSNREMMKALLAGDRRAMARAITLVESTRAADQVAAETLLSEILPRTGSAIRIGISGAPGVGKSTFIEAFGQHLTKSGKRVAVFAIDPSSRRSGGSILGDKTRMERLSRDANAFIRPSPAGTTLATASFDANIGIWQREGDGDGDGDSGAGEWECMAQLEGHETECKSVAYSCTGTLLASCSRDKTVWIWEGAFHPGSYSFFTVC